MPPMMKRYRAHFLLCTFPLLVVMRLLLLLLMIMMMMMMMYRSYILMALI